jgi:hypothetical protein
MQMLLRILVIDGDRMQAAQQEGLASLGQTAKQWALPGMAFSDSKRLK